MRTTRALVRHGRATFLLAVAAASMAIGTAGMPARAADLPTGAAGPGTVSAGRAAVAGPPPAHDPSTPTQAVAAATAATPATPPPTDSTPTSASAPPPPAAASPNAPLDLNKQELRRSPAARSPGGTDVAPVKSPVAAPTLDSGRVGLALAAVVGLILLMRWAGRKFLALPQSASSGLLQVVARTPLAPRQQLLLVRVGRRVMVIGDSGGRLSGLGQIDDPDEVASLLGQVRSRSSASPAGAGGASFASLFGRLGQNFGRRPGAGAGDEDELGLDDAAPDSRRSERDLLLGGPVGTPDGDADVEDSGGRAANDPDNRRPYTVAGMNGHARLTDVSSELPADEAAAQEAVEAARNDIQALRARLREVTERLTDPNRPPTADPGTAGGGAN